MGLTKLYQQTLLAEASYADFSNIDSDDDIKIALQRIGTKDGNPDDPESGFSQSQAEDFVKHWQIISHIK